MPSVVDLTGKSFGRLTVVSRAANSPHGKARWVCRCECGTDVTVVGATLTRGATSSCGCSRREKMASRQRTHGLSKSSPIYGIWKGMRKRCSDPSDRFYHRYGGRGIGVCDRWLDFANFHHDMIGTYRPGLTIERRDVDSGYSPENCCWVTLAEQFKNTSQTHWVEFDSERMCLADAARKCGLSPKVVRSRLARGWSIERALRTPLMRRRKEVSAC